MDNYGRRKIVVVCGVGILFGNIGLSIATNFTIFGMSLMLCGTSMAVLGGYTLPLELMPPHKRWVVGVMTLGGWSIGSILSI